MKNNGEGKSRFKGSGKEIDLIELIKKLWQGRRLLIRTAIIFTVFGLTIAILTPKEFTASTTLVPQTSGGQSNLGGLSSLASMAGFNLDLSRGASDISPQIYPQIIQSVPFQLEIMNTPFTFSGVEEKITLFDYYSLVYKPGVLASIKKYTIGLPGVI